MSDKSLAKILFLAEQDLFNAKRETLEEFEKQDGSTVEKKAKLIREKVQHSLLMQKKERLKEVRATLDNKGVNKVSTLLAGINISKKKFLEKILTRFPEIQPSLTFQNRDLNSLTDEDVEIALQQLDELGVIEEFLNKK